MSPSPARRSSSSARTPAAVFGDYIDVYDIAQAVADGATVPIYYEARVAKIEFDDDMAALLDAEFDEATETLSEDDQSAMARKWSRVEALVGAEKRLDTVVEDILEHFDARLEAIDGKAMMVCMSRRICVEVYKRIVAARPDWHGETDDTGAVKVVMTGNATDPASFQPHIRSKSSTGGPSEPLPGPERSAEAGDRPRHVAHGLRCTVHAHALCRQADARARAHAGHRPGEPGVPGQALGVGGRLHRPCGRAEERPGPLLAGRPGADRHQ